jgi:hypothetical protein
MGLVIGALMLCWAAGWAWPSHGQQLPGDPPKETTTTAPSRSESWTSPPPLKLISALGEQLEYTVSWANYLIAARLTLHLMEFSTGSVSDRSPTLPVLKRDGLQLTAQARTVGVVRSLFIAVDDQFISYVDPETLLPFRFEKRLREGKRQVDLATVFDQKDKVARTEEDKPIAIEPDTRDALALLHSLRTLDLSSGKTYRLPLLFDDEPSIVIASPEQQGRIQTAAGSFEAIEVALRAEESRGKKKEITDVYRVRVWLSNDERRLPALITARPSFGEVKVELINSR